MTTEKAEKVIAVLLGGEEWSFGGDFGGDPWSGYSRWITVYGYDKEKDLFYSYIQEEISGIGFTLPSDKTYFTREVLVLELLKED